MEEFWFRVRWRMRWLVTGTLGLGFLRKDYATAHRTWLYCHGRCRCSLCEDARRAKMGV
jgi:hypothetical protein